MAWIAASEYAITDGRHHIARLLVNGTAGYLLWLDGKLVTGKFFDTSSQAAQYARAHEKR